MNVGIYLVIFLSLLFLLGTSCLVADSFLQNKVTIKKQTKKYKSNYQTYENNNPDAAYNSIFENDDLIIKD